MESIFCFPPLGKQKPLFQVMYVLAENNFEILLVWMEVFVTTCNTDVFYSTEGLNFSTRHTGKSKHSQIYLKESLCLSVHQFIEQIKHN